MDQVLLIGDELTQDAAVAQALERDGWQVLRAAGRDEGFALIREHCPTVVILDHQLEGEDGLELLKRIREADRRCEVILVTEGGEVDIAIEVLRAGALDYLRRPVDQEQLRVAMGRARERRPQRESIQPPTILVVEDHDPTRKRLVRVLEKEGYSVLAAADGEEGLRLFREQRVDLILADLRMPRMGGLSLLGETKGRGADVEVIVITGYGDEDSVVSALRQGAINFLRKPVDIEQMLLSIQKALDFQTVRRSLAYRNRDVQLMQEMVVRLTRELEVVIETPDHLSKQAVGFLHQLVDALPIGIVVAGSDRRVMYANRHVAEKLGRAPEELSTEWLQQVGVKDVTEKQLADAYAQAMRAKPGVIETLVVSRWAFLVMTPLKLMRPDGTQRFVAVAIRGERNLQGSDPTY